MIHPESEATPAEEARRLPRPSLCAGLVGALAALVFAPALGGDFIYDDVPLISNNVFVHAFGYWRRWLTSDFWGLDEGIRRFGTRMVYWRPAVTASYALDWRIGGGSPVHFHATNLALHAVASMLAFFALRRWTGTLVPALLATLLFALHPTKAESVAWIAGRTDVLCAVGLLLAAAGVARRLRGERGALAMEIGGTLLAYLAKEQAIVLFALYALEAWVAAGRPPLGPAVLRRLAWASSPQIGVALVYAAVRATLLPLRSEPISFSLADRVRQVAETLGRYAELIVVPHDLSVQQALLCTDQEGRILFSPGYMAAGAACAAALLVAMGLLRRRHPEVTVSLALFTVTLLPTSNLVPAGMKTLLSERFLYVPMLGLALLVAFGLEAAGRRGRGRPSAGPAEAARRPLGLVASRTGPVAFGTGLVVAVLYGWGSAAHSADFSDPDRFWSRELALHPDSLVALGYQISRAVEEHRIATAMAGVARAHEIALRWHRQEGSDLDYDLQGLDLAALLVPDADTPSLEALERFYGVLADHTAPVAEIALGAVEVRVPLEPAPRRLSVNAPRIFGARATVASRLGRDVEAVRWAEAAHAGCPGCLDVGKAAALAEARAGEYDRAGRVLDTLSGWLQEDAVRATREVLARARRQGQEALAATGVSRLHARASELSTLQAWGRAYDILAPHAAEIREAPGYALGFAELAWRAGHANVTRDILRAVLPEREIEPTLRGWSQKMGWLEPQTAPPTG